MGVLLGNKNSVKSASVQQELGGALIKEKNIIPILVDIEPEELPGWVGKHQAIDYKSNLDPVQKEIEVIEKKMKSDQFWSDVTIIGLVIVSLVVFHKSK